MKKFFSSISSIAVLATLLSTGAISANTYTIDAIHSAVVLKVQHFGAGYTYGVFSDIQGDFTLDDKNQKNSKVSVVIKAASINTQFEKRDQHLKSPDFLNAAQFPEIKFVSKTIVKEGNGYRVNGDLTLRGTTKPVSFLMNVTGKGKNPQNQKELIGLEGNLTIKRSQFGVNFMAGMLGEDVIITIAIEGTKK